MATEEITSLENLIDNVGVDKVGVVRLEDWKDTPLWEYSRKYMPRTKSVIVLVQEVFPEVVNYLTSRHQVGEMAMRDLYKRSLHVVNGHLDWEAYNTIKKLHRLGYKGLAFTAGDSPTDTRLMESAFSHTLSAASSLPMALYIRPRPDRAPK